MERNGKRLTDGALVLPPMELRIERLSAALTAAAGRPDTQVGGPPPDADSASEAHFSQAAVAVILSAARSPQVLLMKRVERSADRWSGQVCCPGGHAEPQDRDLIATAIRETREELGFDLGAAARVLGPLPSMQARARDGSLPMRVHPFAFALTHEVELQPGPEASEAFWLPVEKTLAGVYDDQHAMDREGQVHHFPCWNVEGHVVWGMTRLIVAGLLEQWSAARAGD